MRFTTNKVKSLKPRSERYEIWEDGGSGLGLRIAPSGRKSWVYLYRFEGRPRRMTLGTFPNVGIATAHVLRADASESKSHGVDPGKEHVERRRAERNAETVSELIDLYLTEYAASKKSVGYDRRLLNKEVKPLWGKRRAKDITRHDARTLLRGIVKRGAPVFANRTRSIVSKMFSFALDEELVETNPFLAVKRPTIETSRDRTLNRNEIRTFWAELGKAKMTTKIQLALKFLLVTMQRRSEVVAAPWSEFVLEERAWNIPGSRTKNSKPHRVPLSKLAMTLLEEIKELSGDSGWLFPSTVGDQHILPSAVTQALKGSMPTLNIDAFTPHDLRRTGNSQLAAIGIPKHIRERLLNHADRSTEGEVYNQYEYWPEKVSALDAWSSLLSKIVSDELDDNVARPSDDAPLNLITNMNE
jgi:integrase